MDNRVNNLSDYTVEQTLKELKTALEEIKTRQSLSGEVWLQTTPQWDGSWTTLSTYQYVTGSFALINFNDWQIFNWYFEVIGFVDAGTGYFRLMNITDNEVVAESEIFTTAPDQFTADRIRSVALPKPTGSKLFRVQIRIEGGNGTTEFVNCIMSRIVMRVETSV